MSLGHSSYHGSPSQSEFVGFLLIHYELEGIEVLVGIKRYAGTWCKSLLPDLRYSFRFRTWTMSG